MTHIDHNSPTDQLWGALADPNVLHRVNKLTRLPGDLRLSSPEWHTHMIGAIRIALALADDHRINDLVTARPAQPITYHETQIILAAAGKTRDRILVEGTTR